MSLSQNKAAQVAHSGKDKLSPMVQFNNVSFTRNHKHILRDIHLTINKGEHWVILGRNGTGKTTILELMNGFHFPSGGQIKVLGQQLGQVDVRALRKSIGYISPSMFEKFNLQDPVWEVVATGASAYLRWYEQVPSDVKEKAHLLLEEVGLQSLANHPLGLLSQGERKKVLIARAMMNDPLLYILDEACAGLDLYEREKLLEDLQTLSAKGTLVYVTHYLEEITPLFTHVALVKDGTLLAKGEKRSILTTTNVQKAYDLPLSITWNHDRPSVHL
ncbi:ABC transporter ATP-binding protein [Longirhabdus pacifica]|uniref:ABC transporter ATP-binding protein n=1 Tax=Longirhabdus pacifica TaxID=2305227 RepID=UPI0027B8E2C2|nr:ATP-binding cassette domain-containing protein [Longirhabdus pacifica]